jgi:xylan 1,4-beta-xylosidase
VGRDFYLVNTSLEYFPGVPLFHSTDLVRWRQIGHCLTRPSQLDLAGARPSRGIFAPTLRHHRGVFYLVTTNVGKIGNFFVTATDPRGPWSEPLCIDDEWFDPSLFFDDDGTAYYTRRGDRGIVQSVIDVTTGRLQSPPRMIVDRYICTDIEGPHLYKIRGWYFLMAAEGGSRFGHAEVIGRSRSPWGPFETCPANPLITRRDRGHGLVRDVGHGDLVDDPQGDWWMVLHGTRNLHYNSFSILGRETFLLPVTWTSDDWPVVSEDPEAGRFFPDPAGVRGPECRWQDDFEQPGLGPEWNFLRNPGADTWSLSERPGFLRLKGSPERLDDLASPAFIGRRQEHFQMTASALVEFIPSAEHEEAGMTVFMNNEHHAELFITLRNGRAAVLLRRRVGDVVDVSAPVDVEGAAVTLSITCDGTRYHFWCERPDRFEFGSLAARLLSPEVAHEGGAWSGMYVGVYATGNGRPCAGPADFDRFLYEGKEHPA